MDVEEKEIMKKTKKQILCLLGVLVLLCALYGAMRFFGLGESGEEETETESAGYVLVSLDQDSMTALSYSNEGELLSFTKEEDNWIYDGDPSFPLDQSIMSQLTGALSDLTVTREVQDTLDNLSEYGLSEPVNTVQLTMSDGTAYTWYVGNENSVTGEYYFYMEGDSHVYMTDTDLPSTFGKGLYDLIEAPESPSIDETAISQVQIQNGNTSLILQKYEDGRPDLDYSSSYLWFFREGQGEEAAAYETAMDDLKAEISGITYQSCANYNASQEELSQYGLLSHQGTVTVQYTETITSETESDTSGTDEETEAAEETVVVTLVLEIGAQTEDGTGYYVREQGTDQVNILDSDTAQYFLNITASSFENMDIAYISLDQVSAVDITCDGKTMTIEVTRSTQTDEEGNEETVNSYFINGAEVEATDFTSLYSELLSISGEALMEEGETAGSEPEISLTFHLTENQYFPEVTISYIPYDTNYYGASVNGQTRILVNKMDVAALKDTLEEYLQ